jgi:hypothetical protein
MECKNFVFAGRYGWLPAKSYDFALQKRMTGKGRGQCPYKDVKHGKT